MAATPRLPRLLALGVIALAACTPAPGTTPPGPAASAVPDAPNVLIVITDDQRNDTMAAMPATRRWFGAGGTRFENAFVTTPLCCPSRASIFTGRMTHNHGVTTNTQGDELDETTTLQRYLHDAGYRTAIAGKYFNKWDLGVVPGYFDRWAIFNTGYRRAEFNVDGRIRTVDRYVTDYLAGWSERFIRKTEESDDQPWLLYVTPYAPHRPSTPAERHADAAVPSWRGNPAVEEDEVGDKPPFVQGQEISPERGASKRALQLRSLMAVDDLVDRLMDLLGELEEREETLAFFVSDNGFFWSEHGLRDKRLPYLQSAQVPMYMRWPGRVEEWRRDTRLVANVDIAPTVMEAAGLPGPAPPMDGRSLLRPSGRDHIVLEYFEAGGKAKVPAWGAVIRDGVQYVEYDDPAGGVAFREFYDLRADPWQLQNLLADGSRANDPVVAELARLLEEGRRCVGIKGPRPCP